jgi:hypothetical protein
MAMTMPMQTLTPEVPLPSSGADLDSLLVQMEAMNQSLQGVMGQLDQKSANLNSLPAGTPTTIPVIDMQAVMNEMQSINQAMAPLMVRIQADLQGTPSADELASVRAQVLQINTRIENLLTQLQAARGSDNSGMAADPSTMTNMSGMSQQPAMGTQQYQNQVMMAKLEEMMQKLQQMQSQHAQSGNMSNMPGPMGGMNMAGQAQMSGMDDMMATMNEMVVMMNDMMNMPGMSTSSNPSMNGMMQMMDNMMMMMDDMMSMPDM